MRCHPVAIIVLLALGICFVLVPAEAQQPTRVPRIGLLDYAPSWEPLRQGLRELGYVEDQNLILEYRPTGGRYERLPALAAELVQLPVDIIVTFGTPSTLAARDATTTIPIVMVAAGDPLGNRLVASLARPEGNITGLSIMGAELSGKRLELLREVVLTVSRVAFLWNPTNLSHVTHFADIQGAAKALGVQLISVEVSRPEEFERALTAMLREGPDALIMTADPMHQLHAGRIVDFASTHRLPTMHQLREHVVAGGLMSYGASLPELLRRGALYVHKILQGTKPADLPVERPMTFELVINLKTAQALGLTIPPSLLFQANEVIR
jgi:putative tryptophan/tyrosine transport system substrate-binding protein